MITITTSNLNRTTLQEATNGLPQDTDRIAKTATSGEQSPVLQTPVGRGASYINLLSTSGPSFLNRTTFFSSPTIDGDPHATLQLEGAAEIPPEASQQGYWNRAKNTLEV